MATVTQAEIEAAIRNVFGLDKPATRKRGGRQGALQQASGMFVTVLDSAGAIASPGAGVLGRTSVGIGDSVQAAGKVTAPGAGAAICTLAAPPAGVYAIEVDLVVSANTDVNNMKMQKQAVDLFNPILAGNLNVSQHNYRITLNGSQNLTINAVIAGTAGVVYQAQIIATRVE